jgi:hypothetical protein
LQHEGKERERGRVREKKKDTEETETAGERRSAEAKGRHMN